jgi:hypothetical protein
LNELSDAGFTISSSMSIAIADLDCSAQPISERRAPVAFQTSLPGDPVVAKDCKLVINVDPDFVGEFPALFAYGPVVR